MQTPLAYLSFNTMLEYILDSPLSNRHILPRLNSEAKQILSRQFSGTVESQQDTVESQQLDQVDIVEFQVLVQVIAQRIAETIVSGSNDEDTSLLRMSADINVILDDHHHGMVIFLHCRNNLGQNWIPLIQKKISEIGYGAISCIKVSSYTFRYTIRN